MVHGAASSTMDGSAMHYGSPEATGVNIEFTPSLKALEPYRDYITIISDTDLNNAAAFAPAEDGADHTRSSAVFLTAAHPKMTEGSDIHLGTRSINYTRRCSARRLRSLRFNSADGTTALRWATLNDDVPLIQTLLKAHADVKPATRDEALTALHIAASTGDPVLIKKFLIAGADPNGRTTTGATPLMRAAPIGSVEAVNALIAAGAAVNAKEAKHNETALMFAAGRDRADVIRALLAKGADPSATTTVVKLERRRVDEDGNPIAENPARSGTSSKKSADLGGFAKGASKRRVPDRFGCPGIADSYLTAQSLTKFLYRLYVILVDS